MDFIFKIQLWYFIFLIRFIGIKFKLKLKKDFYESINSHFLNLNFFLYFKITANINLMLFKWKFHQNTFH